MLRKIYICLIFCIIFLSCSVVFAENYIDESLSQEMIERDEYFEEDAQLLFINDVFSLTGFETMDDINDIETMITTTWNRVLIQNKLILKPIFKWYYDLYYDEDIEDKLPVAKIQSIANDNKLVVLLGYKEDNVDIYFIHPSEEICDDILYTSTVSNQNWYKLKTKISALKENYSSLIAYYTDFQDPFNLKEDIGYINVERVNFRTGPSIEDRTFEHTLSFSQSVKIIAENSAWYKIEYNNQIGYIYKQYITLGIYTTPAPTATPTPKPTNTPRPTINLTSAPVKNVDSFLSVEKAQLGKPYVGGGIGPNDLDCSGFVYYCMKSIGLSYIRTNADSYAHMPGWTYKWNRNNLAKGDLVFFYNNSKSRIQHVGIYIGNDQIIHASSGSGKVVIASLSSGWLNKHYAYACDCSSFL